MGRDRRRVRLARRSFGNAQVVAHQALFSWLAAVHAAMYPPATALSSPLPDRYPHTASPDTPRAAPPEQGCITAQAIAEDLKEFLQPSRAGQACQGSLVLNEVDHSVLHITCASAGENESVFKAPPAILEITRASPERFTVTSTMSAPRKPTLVMKQDYKYLDVCPMLSMLLILIAA